jgi:hypothetical protein
VEVLTAYSNPSELVRELREALARPSGPNAPADEPELSLSEPLPTRLTMSRHKAASPLRE